MQMVVVLIVFMFGFGAIMQALMYHNQDLNYSLLANVFIPGYFVLTGQYFLLTGSNNPATNMYPSKSHHFLFLIFKVF